MRASYFIAVFVLLCLVKHAHADGFGSDIPRNVSCTGSSTDGTMATCQFDTTNASDTEIQLIDTVSGNNTKLWHDSTMCVPSGGVCHHTIALTQLTQNATFAYFASACTHAHYAPTSDCPRASPDMSSTGPIQLIPVNNRKNFTFTTVANPGGILTSWYDYVNAPQNVFAPQAFIIVNNSGIGIGGTTTGTSPTLVRYLVMHDVSIDTPSGTVQCGTAMTLPDGVTPYRKYGDATGIVPCQGGSPTNDFIITLINNGSWIQNSSSLGLSFGYGGGNSPGYNLSGWGGGVFRVFVKVGSGVAPGAYTLHYHLQPLFGDGTGNQSGQALVSQDKTLNVAFNVVATTPLGNHPPASFPAWNYMGIQLAMSAYWGTWNCTNKTDSAYFPWALSNYSGIYENVPFTWTTWGEWFDWNYDGGRLALATGDLLFATTHPDWTASHSYTIGDLITDPSTGTTYIMNAVGGASSPGLSGASGGTRPSFSIAPNSVTADGTLQWMSVGNPAFWQGCSVLGNDGFRNVIVQNQATNNFEPSMFPSGIIMHYYRTKDSAAGDETGFSYTESNGRFGGITGLTAVAPSCMGLTASGTSTYVTGLDALALCYSASVKALGATIQVNDAQSIQMRPKGLQLQQQDAYWMILHDPTWLTTDDGLRTQRMVDVNLGMLDMWATMRYEDIAANRCGLGVGCNGNGIGSQMGNFYMSGQVAEGLLHYYQATVYYSNAFPGTTVTPDERIPIALKRYADTIWVKFWDRVYDENQSAADACGPTYPTICQNTPRRIHSYSFPYNIQGLSDIHVRFEFYNIPGSNSEVGWIFSWLWARDSTMTIPDNGRNSPVITSYGDAARQIFQHTWNGNNCYAATATGPGSCSSWDVPDYYNGGRTVPGAGFIAQLGGPKGINQTTANLNSEGLNWLTGAYTWQQGAMVPSTNPCWIVANRNADGSCNAPSPYADVQPPYPMMFGKNGSNPYNFEPAICIPGGTNCRASQPFGSNKVPLNMTLSPGTLTGNQAIFNFMTVKNATCWVVIGTTTAEPASPVVGVNRFNEQPAHTPSLAGGTPLPLWFHSITATGLTVSTLYHFGLYCQDAAGNLFNFPYYLGTTPPKISIDAQQQVKTFTTLSAGLQMTTAGLPDGLQGSSYSATLGASGGTPPYTWSVASGSLPAGLSLNGSTGVITGSPTGSGTTSFTLRLADSTSTTVNLNTSILVQPLAPPLSIGNSSFPDGQVGIGYSQNLVGVGGTPPYTWSTVPATIGGGLVVDPVNGIIGGSPTAAGAFPFTLTVTDSTSTTASASYSISIAPTTVGIQVGKKTQLKGAAVQ